jgi:hypothetical protein
LDAINDITISSSVLSSSVQCIMRSTSCPFLLWVYTCQGPTPHLLCALTQHIPNHSYRPKQTAFSALIPWQPSMMPLSLLCMRQHINPGFWSNVNRNDSILRDIPIRTAPFQSQMNSLHPRPQVVA